MGFVICRLVREERICLTVQEMQKMWVHSLGWKDPLEDKMATHSSILAWRKMLIELNELILIKRFD